MFSCGTKVDENAVQYLESIQQDYQKGEYENALNKVDSLEVLFPKAFDQIKQALVLKQDIRKSFNEKQIGVCDSLIATYQSKIDSIKPLFLEQKRDDFRDRAVFIPKTVATASPSATLLRAGVNEDGEMYVESVYLGGQRHNLVSATSKDKQSVASLPINDDGFNYRFSNLGQTYEVIQVSKAHDNGLARFIATSNTPLTITLKGKNSLSYALSNVQKKAVADTYQLSRWMGQQDSLKLVKEKAESLIKYVDFKKGVEVPKSGN